MNIFLVLLVLFGLAILVSVYLLGKAVYFAWRISQHAYTHTTSNIRQHKKWVNRFLWSLIPPVLIIETMVRLHGGRWGHGTLFATHMSLVATFVITTFLMRAIFTGEHSPTLHRALSKVFFISFLAMTCTGSILLWQLFSVH